MKYLIKNIHLIDPACSLNTTADMLIENGIIAAVGNHLEDASAEVLDRSGHIGVPGLVDMHVHLRDPGQEYKETIASGTQAAAHGGFTAVCAMPNTNPVCDTASVVDYVVEEAQKAGHCKVYPAGSCTKALEGSALSEMGDMVGHGAVAFTDDGRGVQNSAMMRLTMDYAKMFNKVLMSHCQDEALVGNGQVNEGKASTRLGLAGWPSAGEEIQIQRDIALCELTGCPLHIQHITTARGVQIVKEAKERGVLVTCEVTPHHLFLNEDDITDTYDTNLKVNPPLRTPDDNKALIEALKEGIIDCIVTDHAPHAAHEKQREFELAPFGMTGLETSLGLVLTYLVKPGIISYEHMVDLMAHAPRKILRLELCTIEPGQPADITIFDPNETWKVSPDDMYSKSKNSGFLGYELTGRATDVFVSGRLTMKEGNVLD